MALLLALERDGREAYHNGENELTYDHDRGMVGSVTEHAACMFQKRFLCFYSGKTEQADAVSPTLLYIYSQIYHVVLIESIIDILLYNYIV